MPINNLYDSGHVLGQDTTASIPNVTQVTHGGPLDASEINKTFARLLKDRIDLLSRMNTVEATLENFKRTAVMSTEFNNSLAKQLQQHWLIERVRKQAALIAGTSNDPATHKVDFNTLDSVRHSVESTAAPGSYNSFPLGRRARFDSKFGVATLPHSKSVSLFRGATQVNEPPIAFNATVDVTISSDGTAKDTGYNDTKWIHDGRSDRIWGAYAKFPLDSAISEVDFDITIQVPQETAKSANVLKLSVVPNGHCDITELKYDASGGTPTTDLISGFTTVRSAGNEFFHFEDQVVGSIKVSLRSRRWVEENGDKVFYVGIGDLDLQLVGYDDTYNASQTGLAKLTNNGFFDVVEIPHIDGIFGTTCYFNEIQDVRIVPSASSSTVSGGTNKGIRVSIFSDSDLNTQVWDSISDSTVPESLASSVDKLYIVFELDKLSTGMTPVIEGYEIDYTVRI